MLPREKFLNWGVTNLSFKDLISIIISSGIKGTSVFDISRKVEKLFKQGKSSFEDLRRINGVGDVTAMKLSACVELGLRYISQNSSTKELKTTQEAYETLRYMGKYTQEHFVGIFLNARYQVVGKKTLGIGSVSSVHVLPRDIILSGIRFNASFVIIAHNHPSGNLRASNGDIEVTKRIKNSLEIVGMELLDHLIISNNGWSRVEII